MTESPPRKPMIAAVEGYALGGGCEIVLACDLVVAAENAKFGIPEVKHGLVAAAGGLLRLPRRIPYAVAMELALTGDFLDARPAHAYGLVNRLTAPGGALEGALELARAIAANGPLAVRASKQVVAEAATWPPDETWRRMRAITGSVFASDDAKEGPRAFARIAHRAGRADEQDTGHPRPAVGCPRDRTRRHRSRAILWHGAGRLRRRGHPGRSAQRSRVTAPRPRAVRGRTSIAVDLKHPDGAETVRRLIAGADAVIEGFRPDVLERLGLGPDVCLAANPRLVYARVTGWGQDGPLAQTPGHDINYLAISERCTPSLRPAAIR